MWHHCRDGGGGEIERFRLDAARLAQGDNEVPAFVGHGRFDLFIVVATIGQHQHRTPIVSANVVLQGERAKRGHDALMFTVIGQTMRLASPLAREGIGRRGTSMSPRIRTILVH